MMLLSLIPVAVIDDRPRGGYFVQLLLDHRPRSALKEEVCLWLTSLSIEPSREVRPKDSYQDPKPPT